MPQQPNFNRGTGRLTTDRFDFEKHVNATDNRHDGYDIDLIPTVTISGNPYTTVRGAIDALNAIVSPASIQDATGTIKGILKLAGDFGGTASVPKVIGLQSKPVSTLAPTNGQILTWNNGTQVWEPQTSASTFVASNDLSGSNVSQNVVSLTGFSGTTSIKCVTLSYLSTITSPIITQTDTALITGNNLTIRAQGTTGINLAGGTLVLSGGAKNGSGAKGGVQLKMNAESDTLLQLVEPITNQKVLGLLKNGTVSSADMPANTGDLVAYIANTATPPTSGSPSNGIIMFAEGGVLKIKQSDGTLFSVGSIPNPSLWGPTGAQTYSKQFTLTTTTAALTNTIVFNLPDNTSTKLDILVVARNTAAAQSAQFNMTMGYVRFGGSPVAVGGVTSSDPRSTAGASTWGSTIISSGNDAVVQVIGEAGKTINWFIIVQAVTDA